MDPELERQIEEFYKNLNLGDLRNFSFTPAPFLPEMPLVPGIGALSDINAPPVDPALVQAQAKAMENLMAEENARFSRGRLDSVGQKIYDQLKQQKEGIVKNLTPEQAKATYESIPYLSGDETLAFMAERLRDSGITDIYKVKKEEGTQRVPIEYGTVGWAGDQNIDGYYYQDPRTGQVTVVDEKDITGWNVTPGYWQEGWFDNGEGMGWGREWYPEQRTGYIDLPKTTYINTETGQPLRGPSESWVLGEVPFGASPKVFQGAFLGDRTTGGVGVEFTDDGAPIYFAQGYKRPSSWVRARENFFEPLLAGVAGAYFGPAAAATVRGLQTYHDTGSLGDAAKAAALSYASSQLMAQLQTPEFNVPSPSDFAAMEAAGFDALGGAGAGAGADLAWMDAVSPGQIAGAGAGLLPGEAGIDQILGNLGSSPDLSWMDAVSPGQVAAIEPGLLPGEAGIEQILNSEGQVSVPVDVAPTPSDAFDITDYVSPELAGAPETSLTDLLQGTPPPEWDTQYPEDQFVPTGSLGTGADLGFLDDVSQSQMEAIGTGDLPGTGVLASLTAFAATPLGRLAVSLGGSALLNKLFEEQQGGGGGGGPLGWSGEIPQYTAVRERVPLSDAGRRPGEYGRRYFSDTTYVPMATGEGATEKNLANIAAAKALAQQQAQGLASLPTREATETAGAQMAAAAAPSYTVDADFVGPLPSSAALPAATTSTASRTTPRYMTPEGVGIPFDYRDFVGPPVPMPALPTYENEPRLTYGLPTVDERLAATDFRTPDERRLNVPSKQLAASPFTVNIPPVRAAAGGLMGLAKGRYLNGATDGMEDKVPASIDGEQPARLSHGEFVIPADVVSHLGNGNSQAGAKRLYEMMDRIRHARTGTKKQGKQINANKYLPV